MKSGVLVYIREIAVVSGLYILALELHNLVWTPIQDYFFSGFVHFASLLYLPFGVYVLAAWLLGWRAALALLPAVLYVFWTFGQWNIIMPSRIIAIVLTITIAPGVFYLLAKIGWDIRPSKDRNPCWPCVMLAGVLISVTKSVSISMVFGSQPDEYFAFMIGDIAGLFFLMMILMLFFRTLRARYT